MRQPKRQWVFVKYDTGEITQYMTPCTKHKAIKLYNNWHGINEFTEMFERMSDILTFDEWCIKYPEKAYEE